MPNPLIAPVVAYLGRLRFPVLFALTAGLALLSWLVPDPLPFLDEIVTALAVVLLANWRKPKGDPPKDGRIIEGQARRE
ncbi:MAG TPA: DUF6116 family protein [Arenimonas sp.]|nr:DUF6116 family protein [Arenimonas sp.]